MEYTLTKKSFGTSKRSTLLTLGTDLEPSSFSFVKDLGYLFVFKKNHCIGFWDGKGQVDFSWAGVPNQRGFRNGVRLSNFLDFPDSICYSKQNNSCYFFEAGGSRVRRIEFSKTDPSVISVFGIRDNDSFSGYFSKIADKPEGRSSCTNSGSVVYFAFSDLNRVVRVSNSKFDVFIGNGQSGFASATDLKGCVLSRPVGVAVNGSDLYIADSNNCCVRRCRDNVLSVIAGHPMETGDRDGKGGECRFARLSSIRASANIGYIWDGNKVKYMSLPDYSVGTIFESDKIVDIEIDGRDLLVLEKI